MGWVLASQGFRGAQSLARPDAVFSMWHLLEMAVRSEVAWEGSNSRKPVCLRDLKTPFTSVLIF